LAAATTLLVGGASKLASPRLLASSLSQVYGLARPLGSRVARGVAGVELAAAALVAAAWARPVGLTLVLGVGAGIVMFSYTAMRRGVAVPCGCFGESSGRPIGVRNLLAGAGLFLGAILLFLPTGAAPASAAAMLPLVGAVALLAVMTRDRSALLAPFRRHFAAPAIRSVPTEPEAP
jgi:hypothetical protein